MPLAVKNSLLFYKKYELDIWGMLSSLYDPSNVTISGGAVFLPPATSWQRFKQQELFLKKKVLDLGHLWMDEVSAKKTSMLLYFINVLDLKYSSSLTLSRSYVYSMDMSAPMKVYSKLKARFVAVRMLSVYYMNISYKQMRSYVSMLSRKDGMLDEHMTRFFEFSLPGFLYSANFMSNIFTAMKVVKLGQVLVNGVVVDNAKFKVQIAQLVSFTKIMFKVMYVSLLKSLKSRTLLFGKLPFIFISYKFLFAYLKSNPSSSFLVQTINVDMCYALEWFTSIC